MPGKEIKEMLDLKKLKKDLGKALAELEAADQELDKATEKGDEDEAKVAQEVYDEKCSAYDALAKDVEKAEMHAKRRALHAKVAQMAEPADGAAAAVVSDGLSGLAGKQSQPAQPINFAERANAHRDAFTKWMQGKERNIDGEQWNLLKPQSAKVRDMMENSDDKDAAKSVVIPPSLAAKCLGLPYLDAFNMGAKYGNDFVGKTVSTISNATTNPSYAQHLVPQEYRAQLQMLPMPEPAVLNKVTMIPSSTGEVTFPGLSQSSSNEFGGVSFSWTSEGGSKPSTEPVFTQTTITCYELCGYTEITERALSRSALSLESILVSLFRPAMNYTLDNVIINGSGSSRPTGILNASGVNVTPRATASTVADADLTSLKHDVKSYHRNGAMYLLGDDVMEVLEEAVDGQSRPLFRSSTASGPYDRLAGYPYAVSENNPSLGTTGDVIFGNMRQYYLVMEEEITIAKSTDYKFRNNVVAFKVFLVVGGQPMHGRAFAKLTSATS